LVDQQHHVFLIKGVTWAIFHPGGSLELLSDTLKILERHLAVMIGLITRFYFLITSRPGDLPLFKPLSSLTIPYTETLMHIGDPEA